MLCWFIHVVENPILDVNGEALFNFDRIQIQSLQDLIISMKEGETVKGLIPTVLRVLHSLYFPHDPSRAGLNVNTEPVNVFFGILAQLESGAPRALTDIPPICARLQFSIRLRGFHYLVTTHIQFYKQLSDEAIAAPVVARPRRTLQTKKKGSMRSNIDSDSDYDPKQDKKQNPSSQRISSAGYLSSINTPDLSEIVPKPMEKNWWT